ncbi:hypothetical protein SUGI_0417510 [Cryptomeria japonica]|uniref:3'-N-debenzoyl-2'-deoxytaxol N-benzoyltransferase n=1 Tax=Cryptomeria japonica TaxID=3369 RepID=UPI002408BD2D|nr:3'-N-debenzoyl-2'-deoxytaxol N-benzoyltransferase [Cryptomeria japonica]GLJ22215.1 hypothetical protein SUGI_0417510 [Cryptomeria japonica]
MEKEGEELKVMIVERCLVRPCLPSPQGSLYLSNLDNQPAARSVFNTLLVYEGCENNLADPAKTIREALSKVLVYYYPLAGRLRKKEDGKLQVECTGEGVLFVEAMVSNNLSVLGDLDYLKPSFKQLLFTFPFNTDIEELHPLVIQVNRFMCGGFVVAVTFNHSIFDGKGLGQFLKGLGEMARGDVMPAVKPVWDRELLKPRNQLVQDLDMVEEKTKSAPHLWTFPIYKESIQMSLILDSNTINYIKQGILEECGEFYTTFEIVIALIWQARTKALELPHSQSTNTFFAVDVRKSFDPPLPNGYYGNGFVGACAKGTAHELVNQPLSYIVNIIKKAKMSMTINYLRSIVDMDQFPFDALGSQYNQTLSDWRWLGFHEVDFGSGCPVNVCPMHWNANGFNIPCTFIFLPPSKKNVGGFKMITWMHPQEFNLFEMEVEVIINKYVKKN